MGGFDDHVAIIGDWVPPSPSPRALFSLFGDEISSRSISEPPNEIKNGALYSKAQEQIMSGSSDEKHRELASVGGDQSTDSNAALDQKMNSRGGLLERMAARAGFNAPRLNTESIRHADLSPNPDVRSPYLTIPPGLSPTTLLESPVFLSNSLVQPSPTTGKFPFAPSGDSKNPTLSTEATDKTKHNFFDSVNSSSFAFKPVAESGPSLFLGSANKITPNFVRQSFPSIEVSVQTENSNHGIGPAKVLSQSRQKLDPQDFSRSCGEKDAVGKSLMSEAREADTVGASAAQSPPSDEQQDEDGDQRAGGESMAGGGPSEDGYNWRKYGQKQVKGSEYPRSYYKCTHPNCPVKKKVERSHEGHITEIIYKGAHNHAKPPPNRRSAIGSSNLLADMQLDAADQTGVQIGADGDPMWSSMQKGTAPGAPDWRTDNLEVTSSASVGAEYGNASNSLHGQNGSQFEIGDMVGGSSTFSNDEDEDDRATHGSVSLGYDGEGDESESKRRKMEAYATEMSGATRAIREPRVVVQTTSEVDILDDGYRWRKYGQKVVKGNPNPRSYYKCTHAGCTVRKHVERASHDLKSVITTYEGKHNHDVPAARNSSHVNSGVPNTGPGQNACANASAAAGPPHLHRPQPAQVHNGMVRFDRPLPLSSFGLPGRQQLGPPQGFSFGMNQHALAGLAMAGVGPPNQGKLPVLPVHHPYLGQQNPVNEMGFMLPKGEPEAEPPLSLPNGSSVYHQIISRLPLGPQM
ncbi:probable WRKY transcription factor 2 [Diospyros lotus]|uniref:probable WRKY transcription factor 2 n=1 Tax=Diospyros lotus TaxID=55363 RepID=UPI002258E07F|nr:probable WRKY transcription factor 2 [Diospyros lotus]XP_052178881.1 probable WRKY transcription factor 2 [Diospyros lotus]